MLAEGHSLFTVLGTRRVPGDTTFPYDSLKAVIRNELHSARVQRRLNRFLVAAGERYRVKLFCDRVARTETPAVNMVTRRYVGFGGSIWPFRRSIHSGNGSKRRRECRRSFLRTNQLTIVDQYCPVKHPHKQCAIALTH